MRTIVVIVLLVAGSSQAYAKTINAEQIYAEWLQHYADRDPDAAIAMTSGDFVMVNNATVMDRAAATAFVEGLAAFILSRQCTNTKIVLHGLPDKAQSLLERVDCNFQTVIGPLGAHFWEQIIVDKGGTIVYDQFSDIANPSL